MSKKKEKKKTSRLYNYFQSWSFNWRHGSMLNNAILTTSMRKCNKTNGVFHQCCITLLILQWAIAVFHIVQSQVCQDIIFCISIHIKAWKYLKYKLHVNPCLSSKDMDPAKKSCFDNIELLDVLSFLSQD